MIAINNVSEGILTRILLRTEFTQRIRAKSTKLPQNAVQDVIIAIIAKKLTVAKKSLSQRTGA